MSDDEEIFYEASESIVEGIDIIQNVKVEEIHNKIEFDKIERKDTIYEIADELRESKTTPIKSVIHSKTQSENSFVEVSPIKEAKMRKEQEQEKLRKLELLSEELKEITVDLEFLRKNLKTILPKNKGVKDKHLTNVFELQNFQADSQQIWVAKFSVDGKYLATGGKSGVLKIWEIFSEDDSLNNYEYKGIISYLKLINETAYRIYTEHVEDIIDICWNSKVSNF
jgi:WD40 repeat protein